jgi:hypothetical protein
VIVTPKGTVKILECGLGPWTRSGRSNEKRDDIFALGTVLFEIVAGRPFGDEFTPAEQRSISKEVPPELETIIGRLLTHDADRAYSSPATAAADLRGAAEAVDRRTDVRPPPTPVPVKKTGMGSLRWVIVLAVLVLIAALAWIALRR